MGWIMQLTWSISTEWFFYLAYPLVCFALLLLPTLRSKLASIFVMTLTALIIVFTLVTNLGTNQSSCYPAFGQIADFYTHSQNSFFRWLIYFSPYSRIAEFLQGCLIAAIYMQMKAAPYATSPNQKTGLILTLAALLLVVISHYFIWYPPQLASLQWLPYLHRTFGFAPAFACVIFCCAYYHNLITRLLSFQSYFIRRRIELLHLSAASAHHRPNGARQRSYDNRWITCQREISGCFLALFLPLHPSPTGLLKCQPDGRLERRLPVKSAVWKLPPRFRDSNQMVSF